MDKPALTDFDWIIVIAYGACMPECLCLYLNLML